MEIKLNLNGEITLEGSKSILNRVLIISTFLRSQLIIQNISNCLDIKTILINLKRMGFKLEFFNNSLLIQPPDKISNKQLFFIKDSGAAFRFLLTRLAFLDGIKSRINVTRQLKERPILPLVEILNRNGAEIDFSEYPYKVIGKKFIGGDIEIPADISSQFISSILLTSNNLQKDLKLVLKGKIVSRPYIEMTLKIMKEFGINSEFIDNVILIPSKQCYRNIERCSIEPDFSSACYFWALGAINSGEIWIKSKLRKSLQPDYKFLEILKKMGAEIHFNKERIGVKKKKLNGVEVDMKDMPDQVPTLAVLALFAETKTTIENISHLKYKESNRIRSLLIEFNKIGANIKYTNDILTIYPLKKVPPHITLNSYSDHRLVMSFYILKSVFPYLKINNKNAVKKSYPNFLEDYKRLR